MAVSRVFWDTNLFIYLFEDSLGFGPKVVALRQKMLKRGDELVTSTLTLGEVLAKTDGSRTSTGAPFLQLPQFCSWMRKPQSCTQSYVAMRLCAPDAVQLACAASFGVDLFVTNDGRLHGRQADGIQFITPLDRVPI
jgi:uncharacterized protein